MARLEANGSPVEQEPVSPPGDEESRAVTRVHQALEQLPASGREVIHLYYFSGLSYEEIARALGISPHAVRGRIQRARRTLARRLSKTLEGGVTYE